MATFNLSRNSRAVFTTNLGTSGTALGQVAVTGFTIGNSQELTIQDGFTFSQSTAAEVITVNEAGAAPARGQRSFNTSLEPVDFSFTTYIRPYLVSTIVECEESVLWNALLGTASLEATGTSSNFTLGAAVTSATYVAPTATSAPTVTLAGTSFTALVNTTGTPSASTALTDEIFFLKGCITAGASACNAPVRIKSASASAVVFEYLSEPAQNPVSANFTTTLTFVRTAWVKNIGVATDTLIGSAATAYSEAHVARSGVNQLQAFGMVMTVDNVTYLIDNCSLDQAMIDFGLDGIASVQWMGKASAVRQLSSSVTYTAATNPVLGGGLTGTVTGKAPSGSVKYLTNKLSTVALTSKLYGNDGTAGTTYTVALTGGSITIANNINYITPMNIGVVNVPLTYYTGTRSITGTLNAYLRTGAALTGTGSLLSQMLADSATTTEPKFDLKLLVGGATAANRVELYMPGCNLQLPTIDTQAVLSTAINFTAQGVDSRKASQLTAGLGYDLELNNDLRVRYFGT